MLKFLFPLLAVSSFAFADQCEYVSKQEAEAAYDILSSMNSVEELCEPCGQVYPKTINYSTVEVKQVGFMSYWGVFLDGKNIDLAYTYANKKNIALLVGCPAEYVSSELPQ